MLNRRHLRIKVLQNIYAFIQSHNDDILRAEKELFNQLERFQDLYLYFLLVFEELASIEEKRLEALKGKRFATDEELNPNLKFIENDVFSLLRDNVSLRSSSEARKINWIGAEEQVMLSKVIAEIRELECYTLYMISEDNSYEADRDFAIEVFKEGIVNSHFIYDYLEEKNIQWADDIDLAASMVIKTIKSFEPEQENEILSLYKDEEDEKDFVKKLFRGTIQQQDENNQLIETLTANWEVDRLALMDVLLMNMALTEAKVFSTIPLRVTLNEYIDISKFYSTPKSNKFINGILDKAFGKLEKEGVIVKTGRGLMK